MIVSKDPYIRSADSIVPTEPCSSLASRSHDKILCDRDDPYVRDDYVETRLKQNFRVIFLHCINLETVY